MAILYLPTLHSRRRVLNFLVNLLAGLIALKNT